MSILFIRAKGGTYINKILSTSPIAYFPLNEVSGSAAINRSALGTAANGTYVGPTLAQVAAPGGGLAPSFDGVNDRVDIYSAALASAFNKDLLTLFIWFKFAAGTWSDATDRVMLHVGVDTANRVGSWKLVAVDTILSSYVGSGTNDNVTTNAYANTAWHLFTITVSKAADELKVYVDGTQIGTTQSTLGTWVGAITNTYTHIASYEGTNYYGVGNFAHAAIYGKVLTQTQLANLYTWGMV